MESRFRPAMPRGEAPMLDERRTWVGAAGLRGVERSPMMGRGRVDHACNDRLQALHPLFALQFIFCLRRTVVCI